MRMLCSRKREHRGTQKLRTVRTARVLNWAARRKRECREAQLKGARR